jgi:hypothetical protein
MAAPLTGQLQITGTAQQLTGPVQVAAFEIKAPSSNINTIYIGQAGVTPTSGHAMEPGDRLAYQRSDQHGETRLSLAPADFYAVGTPGSSDVLTWLGSP